MAIFFISVFLVLFMTTCGQEDDGIRIKSRIIGGRKARVHEYPNQVAINLNKENKLIFMYFDYENGIFC